jgi:DNA-binding CsgD family transcriptional regulator/tetratricopeptide (TPR) repeat protein
VFAEQSVLCPVLIGRTNGLELAARLIETALHDSPQTLIILGEAGSGKSRLVAEIKARVAPLGFQVLQGYAFEADRDLPFGPLLDLLRTFCLVRSPEQIAVACGSAGAEIVKLLPELALLLPGVRPSLVLEPAAEKLRLFQALAQFFGGQAGAGPLLIILEDLHWADETSLDFLYHLARRPAQQPWLLVLTYRSEAESDSLKGFLAKLEHDRLSAEIVLAPLSLAEVGSMLQAIFRLEEPVQSEFLDTIYGLTEGNPFFVEEVLKALLASGDISYAGARWERKPLSELRIPRTVQVAVQQRTDRLSPAARQLLAVAAVAGRRFDFALLEHVMRLLIPGLDESSLIGLFRELAAAQFVVESESDQFSFRHALTQQAVLADMLARERRPLHRLVAEAIEQQHAARLESHLASLADHFYEAGDWAKALEYARKAGEHAQALYAPHPAIVYFTRAIQAAARLGAIPSPVEPAAALYLARGAAYEITDAFDAARADFEQAVTTARTAGDHNLESQALLSLGFLWAARDYQRAGGYLQKALELARGLDKPVTLAHGLNRVGNWQLNMEQPLEAMRQHREALDLFERLGDPAGVAETLDLMGTTVISLTDYMQGRSHYQRATVILRELDNRPALASSLAMLALCAPHYLSNTGVWPSGQPDEPVQAGQEAVRILQDIGWRSGEALAQVNLGLCVAFQGRYAMGLGAMSAGLEIAQEVEHAFWQLLAHLALGAAYHDLLQLPAAEAHLRQAFTLSQGSGSTYWRRTVAGFLAMVQLAQDRPAAARTMLEGNLPPAGAMATMGERHAWAAWAELRLAEGSTEEALAIGKELILAAPNSASDEQHADGRAIPRLDSFCARALVKLGRLDEAEAAVLGACGAAQAAGAEPMLWRLRCDLSRVFRLQRRNEQAESERSAAESLVDELAKQVPDETLLAVTVGLMTDAAAKPGSLRADFLVRARAQLPGHAAGSSRQVAGREFGGLTSREREVAAMVAQGKSNRAMAEAFVVSERTIEKHVENILSKLAFTSRAQIAVWAVERGLTQQNGP